MSRPWTVAFVLVAASAACGRVRFDANHDAGIVDAPVDAARGSGPFDPPTPIVELNSTAGDDDPTLTADLLEICFASTRSGGAGASDIWCATRATPDDIWNPAFNLAIVNNALDQSTPELSPDGLTLRYGEPLGVAGDIHVTTRADRSAPWSVPVVDLELSSSQYDAAAAQISDLVLYLASDRTGSRDLYRSVRASVGDAWQPPVAVAEVNTPAADSDPFADARELELYSALQPSSTNASRDIYVATRSSTAEPFGARTPLSTINSAVQDSDPWVSPDGRVLVFASERSGVEDLYIARR